jgi:hypothetical protein
MAVNDGVNIGPGAEHFTVDESFEIYAAPRTVDRVTIEREFNYVCGPDLSRRHISGKEEAVRPLIVTDADVAEGVDNALIKQDMIGHNKVCDQRWIG